MGTVFQTVNESVRTPGLRRVRVWLEPGYPQVLFPGLVGCLTINRVDGEYRPHLTTHGFTPSGKPRTPSYRFWVVARALRLNAERNPVAVMVEVATQECLSGGALG